MYALLGHTESETDHLTINVCVLSMNYILKLEYLCSLLVTQTVPLMVSTKH